MSAVFRTEVHVVAKKAGGAIPANSVVKLDSVEGQVVVTTAINDQVFGVAKQTAAIGAGVSIEEGKGAQVPAVAGAAIAVGSRLMPQAGGGGRVVPSAGSTAVDCGVALTAAAGAGENIVMKLNPMGFSPPNT